MNEAASVKQLVALLVAALAVTGCDKYPHPPATAYHHWKDSLIVGLGLTSFGMSPCGGRGLVWPEQCYRFESARRWHGVWVTAFEAQQFCPSTTMACEWGSRPKFVLHWHKRAFAAGAPVFQSGKSYADMDRRYDVDFVGRRTLSKGPYGPNNDYIIVVDRVLSMRKIEPRFSAAQLAEFHAADPGMKDECLEIIRWGGPEALTRPQEDCYKFDPPRRWKGYWFGAFETSRFCPEPARKCPDDRPDDMIWLEVGPSAHVPLPPWDGKTSESLFKIDFVGRKTSYPGGYGHVGAYRQEIIMDRLISIKRMPVPKG